MLVIRSLYVGGGEACKQPHHRVVCALVGGVGMGEGAVSQGPREEQVSGGKTEPQSRIRGATKHQHLRSPHPVSLTVPLLMQPEKEKPAIVKSLLRRPRI